MRRRVPEARAVARASGHTRRSVMRTDLFLRTAAVALVAAAAVVAPAAPRPSGTPGTTPTPEVDEIRFVVTDLPSDRGDLVCTLFTEAGWMRRGIPGIAGEIRGGTAECVFPGIEPGTYAITAYHDENGNGRLDTNFFRVPSEEVCASRGARGRFGPPSFDDARFSYRGGVLELRVSVED